MGCAYGIHVQLNPLLSSHPRDWTLVNDRLIEVQLYVHVYQIQDIKGEQGWATNWLCNVLQPTKEGDIVEMNELALNPFDYNY